MEVDTHTSIIAAEPGTMHKGRQVLSWRIRTRPTTIRRPRMDGTVNERVTTRTDRVPVYAPQARKAHKPHKRLPDNVKEMRESLRRQVRSCKDLRVLEQCLSLLAPADATEN